ncbi:MAG TPA: transcriptional coactivator p15/PC4 family protein [Syntrophorhabdaceae bacterium]|nr:transcriptional coactivator p15/PC4 family protein [Syntrophorhabdaceae bacterium]
MKIGEIQKTGTDRIIVTVKEFKGKTYVDVRNFFENDEGEMVPTKKGISLTPENLDELIRLLGEAKKSLPQDK